MSALLIFSRDPGPTNYLIAVVERLMKPPAANEARGLTALRAAVGGAAEHLVIAARSPGEQMWFDAGYRALHWNGADERAAAALIADAEAAVVLTGTSDIDETGNHALWRVCERAGLESHAVLDHPGGLGRRFRGGDGTIVLPDWIYVPDDVFAVRAEAEGLPAARIRIIGDLHHDRLRALTTSHGPHEVQQQRARWGANAESYVVLFVSECGREMAAAGRGTGYDEVAILDDLLKGISQGNLPNGGMIDRGRACVVVRPHPRDSAGKYDQVVAAHAGNIAVVVTPEGSSDMALAAADLVVGMGSSMLYEAVALGRPAISLVGNDLGVTKSFAR